MDCNILFYLYNYICKNMYEEILFVKGIIEMFVESRFF